MLKIGLTGGIASGKSLVCEQFKQLGVTIIDADQIARQLVEPKQPAYQQIIDNFGKNILLADASLNRRKLRNIIFSDPLKKQQLEAILHPAIRQSLIIESEQVHADYLIMAIPLLLEAEMTDLVDRVLVIDTKLSLQIKRLMTRDQLKKQQAIAIIESQIDRDSRLNFADEVISNNDTPSGLRTKIDTLHQKYTELSLKSCQ